MPTANYSWVIPTVDGSNGVWGELLNDIFDTGTNNLDDLIDTIHDATTIDRTTNGATRALALAGGTMTGTLTVLDQNFTVVNAGNLTGAVTFDLSAGNYFYGTITGNITSITFTNPPAAGGFVTLRLTNGSTYTVAGGVGKLWPGGSPPAGLATAGVHLVTATTYDGGTTWDLAASMLDLS